MIQASLLILWIIVNLNHILTKPWDPYPFILLNLVLSFQAAYTGPILLMAQNRKSEIDSKLIHDDIILDQDTNADIDIILSKLDEIKASLK
jgi:uncharacterized membrane protein